jgi:hypothetical protein
VAGLTLAHLLGKCLRYSTDCRRYAHWQNGIFRLVNSPGVALALHRTFFMALASIHFCTWIAFRSAAFKVGRTDLENEASTPLRLWQVDAARLRFAHFQYAWSTCRTV